MRKQSSAMDLSDLQRRALGDQLLAEGQAEIARLKVLKGSTPKRRDRRIRRANALIALATGLLAFPVGRTAQAATPPAFKSPFPFGLTSAGSLNPQPDFVDIDGDGDLDALAGTYYGDIVLFENTGSASAPGFAAPSSNPFGLADVGTYTAPAFADIDGDGDLDAVVGEAYNVFVFENTGSASAPAFAAPSTDPFGMYVAYKTMPELADIDGDGDLDAIAGEANGRLFFLENTGSSTAPAFAAPSSSPFGLTDVGTYSSPALADIDGDTDLDALIGSGDGNALYFANTGSASVPAFAAPSTNAFGLSDVGFYNYPALVDIDGDGDLDAFIGEFDGNLIFFKNTGSASAPAFALHPFGLSGVGKNSNPTSADIDGDGDLDVFIGEYFGNVVYFENTGSASAPVFGTPTTNPFGLADVGLYNDPVFADIDGDDDLDALIGTRQDGDLVFFENTGPASAPAFGAPTTNPFGLAGVTINADPDLADIDGDGDLDALVGEGAGDTIFFENSGSASAPAFAAASTNPFGLADVGFNSSPKFADLDGDGDLDALVGEVFGNAVFFDNTGSASTPAFGAQSTNAFGLSSVGGNAAPDVADLDGDGDLDALMGSRSGLPFFFENAPPPQNAAPTDIVLSNASVKENKPAGTTVGTLSATDPDTGDTHTFSLVPGTGDTDNDAFTIVGDKLKAAASFDFETDATKLIRVRATDSGAETIDEEFTINVTNVVTKLAIDDVSKLEGDTGTKMFAFTITRTGDLSGPVSVNVRTLHDTTNNADFVAIPTTTFNFGNNVATRKVRVTVNGDTKVEPDEIGLVRLSAPVNAQITDKEGELEIRNDD